MYKIEKKGFGYKITFNGFIRTEEMQQWVEESKRTLSTNKGSFGVLVDMRELKPLSPEAQDAMIVGQQAYKKAGMDKSAVILASTILTNQFKRLAQESGIYKWERYIDASKFANYEKIAENWITKGIDPDL
ncbi:MAG TPA: hypothetical protein PL041_11700 [Melioribacteraceae bacterium]|nr:hypothetical protein [Melioribacteraceae bacterium]